jgi:lytic murein transglycosylase
VKFVTYTVFIVVLALFSDKAFAQTVNKAKIERQFQTWLQSEMWPLAKKRGISRKVFNSGMGRISLNWKVPDLRPPGTSKRAAKKYSQAEFKSPGRYLSENRLRPLVRLGRARLKKWRKTLDAIERRYGVPRRIIMAIWAAESGYGRAKIPNNTLRVLATSAFMGRRKQLFRNELIVALAILQQGHVSLARFKSSWAGALGQPQFMPSKFLTYAVDFNGDGRRDIWNSVPDTLASIANFLKQHGWQSGRSWGFEAKISASISCALEGPEQGKPISHWAGIGAKRVRGKAFPNAELKRTGFLLMPAGRKGPAFIATKNFYVLKKFNESDLYALFIGHLADRYVTNRPFIGKWSKLSGFSKRDVQSMQLRLEKRNVDVGGADGLIGFKTRTAVGTWQSQNNLKPTCYPDAKLIRRIR